VSYSKKNIFICLLFVYALVGFFLLPYLLKPQLISAIEENTKSIVKIGNISFNPFVFSLSLEDVTLLDDKQEKLITFDSLGINVEPSSLFYGAVHVKSIKLVQPKVFVSHNKNKTFNLLNSFVSDKASNEGAEKSSVPRIIIEKVEIQEGSVEYKDYTRKEIFVFCFDDIGFSLEDIDTADMNSTQAELRFYSTLGDGGFIDLRSTITSLEPFIVTGSLEFQASKLYTQWKYLKEILNLEVADGKISFKGEYLFNSADLNATTIKNLNLSLQNLRILPKNGYKDVLNLDLLSVNNVKIKPFERSVVVESIALQGLKVQAKRGKNNKIDWLSYIKINTDKSEKVKKERQTSSHESWSVLVEDVALEKIKLNFRDEGMGIPTRSSVGELKLYAQNISFGDNNALIVENANLMVEDFLVVTQAKEEKLFSFKNFATNDIHLETETKKIEVNDVIFDGLNVYLQRYKDKSVNIEKLMVTKKTQKSSKNPQKSQLEPYHFILKEFFISNSGLTFKDSSLIKVHTQKIDKLNFAFRNIDSKNKTWITYDGDLRLNKEGSLHLEGKLRHTPLKQSGKFELKNLNLKFLNPYFQETSYLNLSDGKLSFKGKSTYFPSTKSADLHLSSSLNLDSLTLNDKRIKKPLLFLNKLQTDSITLELFPNRLYIDEVNIKSFYVDAVIDANKTMNFAKLSKLKKASKEVVKKTDKKEVFPVKILKLNVSSGSAKFSDYSIPIKFSTYIHNLDGVVYAISNTANETTYINIAGDVDEYGSAKIEGSIESANPKAYTDLNLNFQNLDLNSLSGYSASFAGHEIDSGKLYLDLGYDILNSELKGSNNIMMKSVVLGKEVEDENVTVLPLGFVLGLLEDSDGVIDIEMPVEGNVDEPDFKYGTLVLKTIGGLIAKAVTSPFKFLGAAMGIDAEALEYVYFEAGTSLVTPPQREKLDQLAKMLLKKPKISLKFASPYAAVEDKQALQMSKLIDLVMKKSGLKNRKEHKNAMTTDLLEDIYEAVKNDDSLKVVREELTQKYEGEVMERMYHTKLLDLCRDMQIVTQEELNLLAKKRTQNIYTYLSEDKNIDKTRLLEDSVTMVDVKKDEPIALHIEIEIK